MIPLGAYATDTAVYYCSLEPDGPKLVATPRSSDPIPARGPAFPVFAWDEREMADDRGVRFSDPADARPFFARNGRMPEPIVAHGVGVMQIVVGPVHAGIIEPGRFTLSSGGETVVHLDAQLGYAHRGIERALEGRDALAAAPLVARICGSCSAARAHAYALALESLAEVTVGAAARWARLVICELERIVNHLGDLAMCASAAAWVPGFARGLTLKERAMRLCAQACGHRLLFDAIVPGGVGAHVLPDPSGLRQTLEAFANDVEAYVEDLFANASVRSRWQGAGIVTHALATAFGAVGPAHRASGGEIDVRRAAPYGAYRDIPVTVHGARHGDVEARCTVKRDELRTSFALIATALGMLPKTQGREPGALALERGIGVGCIEGARGAEFVAVHLDDGGRIARFHAISASYRNWPVVARAMDGNIIPDFPLVNKSFNLCYACADRCARIAVPSGSVISSAAAATAASTRSTRSPTRSTTSRRRAGISSRHRATPTWSPSPGR
jgi:Ni,Fe-hydrogenase III large subunit